jgi:ribosomal protein S18 acetylase RimI-like enzyme
MIKPFEISMLDELMHIWLEVNIETHSFIPEKYWKDNFASTKRLLPEAEVWVYEEEKEIRGFIGITDKSYIAGLFVLPQYRSEGIGGALLERCKQLYPILELNVYLKNEMAVRFYKKHGFSVEQETEDSKTHEKEYLMRWKKP